MWWALAIDVLWPSKGPKSVERSVVRIVEKGTSARYRSRLRSPERHAAPKRERLARRRGPRGGHAPTRKAALAARAGHGERAGPDGASTPVEVLAAPVRPGGDRRPGGRVCGERVEGGRRGHRFRGRGQDQARRARFVRARVGTADRSAQARRDKGRDAAAGGVEPFPVTCDGDPS